MKAAILSLVVAVALAATAGSADAQPRRYNNPRPVIVYPSINSSPYAYGNALYPSTLPVYNYPNYGYPNYVYPAGGYYSTYSSGVYPSGYSTYGSYGSYSSNYYPPPYVGGYVIPWR